MAAFITRIELGNSSAEDSQRVCVAMAKMGFSRTIVGQDSVRYELPSGEFYLNANLGTNAVLGMARDVVKSSRGNIKITVIEAQQVLMLELRSA